MPTKTKTFCLNAFVAIAKFGLKMNVKIITRSK